MKRFLLGTPLGGVALNLRDRAELMCNALTSMESVGTMANDMLAARLVARICRPGHTFMDVGAHIGSVIHRVQSSVRDVKVIAFEAMADKVVSLRRRFPDIQVFHCAAGDQEGELSFFVNRVESGYSSLIEPGAAESAAFAQITVPVRRIDGLVQATDADVIKIDVEGAELGVLRGCIALLERCRPLIMFESAPSGEDITPLAKGELFELLTSRDYEIVLPNRLAHEGPALSADGFLESHHYPRRTTNYFAVPRERRMELRDRARTL